MEASWPEFCYHERLNATMDMRSAPVAQLDRAIGFEPIGRGFESLRARHLTESKSDG